MHQESPPPDFDVGVDMVLSGTLRGCGDAIAVAPELDAPELDETEGDFGEPTASMTGLMRRGVLSPAAAAGDAVTAGEAGVTAGDEGGAAEDLMEGDASMGWLVVAAVGCEES